MRFQGQWIDEESGLYYNRYRYYDPTQGRYVTQDPIGLMGGVNLFAYPSDPIVGRDPLGLRRSPIRTAGTAGTSSSMGRSGGWSYGHFYPSIGRTSAEAVPVLLGGSGRPTPWSISQNRAYREIVETYGNFPSPAKQLPGGWGGINDPWTLPELPTPPKPSLECTKKESEELKIE
ncbi:RHS repeat-associated core domain-containing protein [Parazoarcus communis]|uniref:RHS repeat-associated core domain-containing protein n=1 Tax=Parazoarcus communis TaxID=41977 RepID=UPI0034D19117